ncbi:glycosyl transferase group 1 [Desulfovibrio sp. X2]|uniref:glycosyltransferase family 4 protein n=1 Tax=Desulfovibrio sp. X2 TaxID=941449 RepID=UPI0003589497|nr:glycosyltransferase family 4 protein [Desulfovibrio sp. X2]EPR44123.1 glycosyl transferase group 1 [Desulfovibrio sp. X2]
MRIAFYMPFKSLDAPNPSGDLVIGRGIHDFLLAKGHDVRLVSRLRTRYIFWKPWKWASAAMERQRTKTLCREFGAELWLTYHAYWKAPDVLGPSCSRALGIPYAVVQASYATKYRKRLLTRPGFSLSRDSLLAADAVVANKRRDFVNVGRLVEPARLSYVPVGIRPAEFTRDEAERTRLRAEWGAAGERPVVLCAAMFRSDVKTRGLLSTIAACARLAEEGRDFLLVIAGDGPERARVEAAVRALPEGRVRLLGLVPRKEMASVYSAADIFAFPGINEALGMAFLEAQSCGLPVVALKGWGVTEAVADNETGLLVPPAEQGAFARAIARLLDDAELRNRLGAAGAARVRETFDQERNYGRIETILAGLAARRDDCRAGSAR